MFASLGVSCGDCIVMKLLGLSLHDIHLVLLLAWLLRGWLAHVHVSARPLLERLQLCDLQVCRLLRTLLVCHGAIALALASFNSSH
jgi:hypothetical protein